MESNGSSININDLYQRISDHAFGFKVALSVEELATLAVQHDFGERELATLATVFEYLSDRQREQAIATLLKLSRLPQKAPKTFENFDFGRIQGRDAEALRKLSSLSNLYARKNIAFIGPGGIGKTHLAKAYGRQCCLAGFKSYYLKASELRDRLQKAARSSNPSRTIASLVKPTCLIIDEIGRCSFDKACTDLFFDVIDRRYEKECPNTMILTSNTPVNNWNEFFTGDETLLCTLDRIFDRATVFIMKGASYRGKELETLTVESSPMAAKLHS